ncbi:hypothetical protein [Nocardia sp. NPDC052566]|uniref:hypothetical protein n=1 Tax=Nocardia sp. NPDC052566 TaxID=3364330 RepID=UPI0037C6A12D
MRWFLSLLILPLAACASDPAPIAAPTATTTTTAAPETRTPQDCDKLTVTALEVEPGIGYLLGTHAEWLPKGQFVRVRVAITNTDRAFHTTNSDDYQLTDAADAPHPVSIDAIRIKRQPLEITLGAGNRLELDLWYDIPLNTAPRQLRDTVCSTTIPLPA